MQKWIYLEKAVPSKTALVLDTDVLVLAEKGKKKNITTKVEVDGHIKLPIKKGSKLGELVVYQDGVEEARFPLKAADSAKKASVTDLYIRMMKKIL